MEPIFRLAAIVLAGIAAGGLAAGGEPEAPAAMKLAPAEVSFQLESVAVLESLPPQFVAVFRAEMPTPGWTLAVDSVETDVSEGRILVKITRTPPAGIVAQVLTPVSLRVHLGSVPVGRYCLEIWMRADRSVPYRLAGSVVLEASDPAPPLGP